MEEQNKSGYPGWEGQQMGWGSAPVTPGWTMPQKEKMPVGLKVFLGVASTFAAVAILGFISFLIYTGVTGNGVTVSLPFEESTPWEETLPSQPEEAPETAVPQPDVDVTPNLEGLTIVPQPKGVAMDAQEVYRKVVESTVSVKVTTGTEEEGSESNGTGIIATSDGYIITNAHVVLNTKNVSVQVTDYHGNQYDAVVVGFDRTTDLAVIKTDDHQFTPAEFGDADELEIGQWVIAIGSPGGERFSGSLTRGVISGLDRIVGDYSENGMTYIQTDAAINPGNSGGPLVNMYGQVVGINSSKIVTDHYEGMGFAIPVSDAKSIIDQLLAGGYVKGRTRLGIMGRDVTPEQVIYFDVPQGFAISSIEQESAFTGTEAMAGDIIIAIDGETVTGLSDISNLLLKYAPGDQVTVTLYRVPETKDEEAQEIDVVITLLEDKGETQK